VIEIQYIRCQRLGTWFWERCKRRWREGFSVSGARWKKFPTKIWETVSDCSEKGHSDNLFCRSSPSRRENYAFSYISKNASRRDSLSAYCSIDSPQLWTCVWACNTQKKLLAANWHRCGDLFMTICNMILRYRCTIFSRQKFPPHLSLEIFLDWWTCVQTCVSRTATPHNIVYRRIHHLTQFDWNTNQYTGISLTVQTALHEAIFPCQNSSNNLLVFHRRLTYTLTSS